MGRLDIQIYFAHVHKTVLEFMGLADPQRDIDRANIYEDVDDAVQAILKSRASEQE
jgi:hypothetical protein